MESQELFFRCKKSQLNGWHFSILTTKKGPNELDTVPNAYKCYTFANGDVILSLLINGHGVKRLHKRFHKFDSVEDPTPEEIEKMEKFAEVKAKHPSKFRMDDFSMDEIGVKADFISDTVEGVF